MQFIYLIFPLLTSFCITVIIMPFIIHISKKWGLIDDPKTHKHPAILHHIPIPRGGAIGMFLGIWIASFFFLHITKITLSLFIASSISLITGIIDDKYDISPYIRFIINIICAIIVVGSGVTVPFITHPLGGILYLNSLRAFGISASDFIAVIWIVWVMNMLNWSKGVDGQMPGIVAIASFVIGILGLRFPLSQELTFISTNISFLITGCALGFLIYNFYPAKIFPGYGATAIYLLLASVSILSSVKLATAILVMGVPMIDGIFTILRRIFHKQSPFRGDKQHLHHLLLARGLNQRQAALFYWIISAIVGGASLMLTTQGKLFAIIMLCAVIGGAFLFLHASRTRDI